MTLVIVAILSYYVGFWVGMCWDHRDKPKEMT
mgnify:CR=1 FL=1